MANKVAKEYNQDVYQVMFSVICLEDLVQSKEILRGNSQGFDKSYFRLAFGQLIDSYKKMGYQK
jgi:hypothetical protein